MQVVVEVEHLTVILGVSGVLERLDDPKKRLESLGHGQVLAKIVAV